jgi:hypothetical protein
MLGLREIPPSERNIEGAQGVRRRMKPDRQPVVVVLVRTAGYLALAMFLILVLLPAALAAGSNRPS